MKGISTNLHMTEEAACLKSKGVTFVFRYYSKTTTQDEKRITLTEAEALNSQGILLAMVYEDGPTVIGYFQTGRGTKDAKAALQYAASLGQPQGSAIYFAVDEDFTSSQITSRILPYFQEIQAEFAAQGTPYRIGVYGSGLVCKRIKPAVATYSWVAESTEWGGTSTYTAWDVKQTHPSNSLCGISTNGYEECVSRDSAFGAFTLGHVQGSSIGSVHTLSSAIGQVLDQAAEDLGVTEEPPGSNRGQRVNAMLAYTGTAPGNFWCAAAVAAWGIEALGRNWPLPHTAGCTELLHFARHHQVLRTTPLRGDIFLRMDTSDESHHTGIVTSVNADGSVSTIEGNTDPAGSNNGYGVFRRNRSTSNLKFVRWTDMLDDFNDSSGWQLQVGVAGSWTPCVLREGHAYVALRELCLRCYPASRVKTSLGWGDGGVTWDGVPLTFRDRNYLDNGVSWAPVRDAAAWLGLEVEISATQRITLIRHL